MASISGHPPALKIPPEIAHLAASQKLYSFQSDNHTWSPITPLATSEPSHHSILHFLTWNIDFSAPFSQKRMIRALDYTEELTGKSEIPTLIALQEVEEECLPILLEHPFVREHFALTDINSENWHKAAWYGTVTLVPLAIAPSVKAVSRVRFEGSEMQRDALLVDIEPTPSSETYRFINVHLESLRGRGDVQRVEQMAIVSQLLSTVHGGAVGGDMNAIAPSDADLPAQNGLVDAWLTVHANTRHVVEDRLEDEGVENNKENETDCTWGYQPPSQYPPGRLDKVLLNGNAIVEAIERVGVGLKPNLDEETEGVQLWVSDHYGLLAKIRLGESSM